MNIKGTKWMLIIIVLFQISACNSDEDECSGRTVYKISDIALNSIPYQDLDEVGFIDSNDEQISLVVSRELTVYKPSNLLVCDDQLNIVLNKTNGDRFFQFISTGNVDPQFVQLSIYSDSIDAADTIIMMFDEDKTKSNLSSIFGSLTFHESILINGQTYKDVYKLDIAENPLGQFKTLLYSAEVGIIKIESYNGYSILRN